jgi:S-adenosylmethionine:tRNA ribosyltransferase-isomerase
MNLADFDYPLPKELIAQQPLEKRDASRLLVARRNVGATHGSPLHDRIFSDIVEYLDPGDVLVLNDTKVFKARVLGKKKGTGGKVDVLFLGVGARLIAPVHDENLWRCLIQPPLKEGQIIEFRDGIEAAYIGRDKDGTALMEFVGATHGSPLHELLEKHGTMPLPPYIKREPGSSDEIAYQTIYARQPGAVAAPTAGLHFTQELLEKIRHKGVEILYVTLHVGYGTFKPVEDLENHRMHSESFELTQDTAEKINRAKSDQRKVWAVGTTTLRVLETCVQKKRLVAGKGETDLYIKAPFPFEAVDRLVTNFHLPKTTLLLLVSAFMGEALRKKAYEHAIAERYRFYSYGDAMVIL